MTDTAFEARQHRIERRRRDKRSRSDDDDEDYIEDETTGLAEPSSTTRKIPLASIKGIKKQARYEPVVPMSKEELSEWRKEARRVRNRESAAASRRKTRERIEELEGQVSTLETKYASALARIAELESQKKPAEVPSLTSAENSEWTSHRVSPTLSPTPPTKKADLPNWSLGAQEAARSLANSLDLPKISSKITPADDGDMVNGISNDETFLSMSSLFSTTDSCIGEAAAAMFSSTNEDDLATLTNATSCSDSDTTPTNDHDDLEEFLFDAFHPLEQA